MKLFKIFTSILLLSIFSITTLHGEILEKDLSHPLLRKKITYVDAGLTSLIIPTLGVGRRIQKEHHGMDFKVQASATPSFLQGIGSAKWLFFPNPQLEKGQFYMGLGGHVGYTLCEGMLGPFIGPNVTLGRNSSMNKRKIGFMELTLQPQIYLKNSDEYYGHFSMGSHLPVFLNATLTFGFGF